MNMNSLFCRLVFCCLLTLAVTNLYGQQTQTLYLSGKDKDNTVNWQFYCTEGRNSGKWTKIPVPSNWEMHGFGTYNYGHDKEPKRGKEKGLYKYQFKVPANWKNKTINIVLEGSMTDTEVKINGQLAGPIHQGSFYRFKYDVTNLINTGKTNTLEVTVAKHSSNESVNKAERFADFWLFGGIFRPVYLEALPEQHIERTALDAHADGSFTADVYLKGIENANEVAAQIFTLDGQKFGTEFKNTVKKGDALVQLRSKLSNPALWSPEFPNLYKVEYTLLNDGKAVHTVSERFGFRTVELRERDGIYVNGTKIKFRGVNRHSFWPESGRTMSKKLSILDVELMKDMNMNAVRMSHYPPDKHFLEVCDSLGLFVINELTGWHDAYDTEVGTILTKELVIRDVNHPSVIMWANGNEGGHNFDLDPIFDEMDIQKRPVIHPWQVFRGTDTQHYINYNYGNGNYFQGHEVFFPTEFLHGLYDGGHGAGLYDYWELMWKTPLSAGGFLWVLADEGIVRTDKKGEIDTDGNHGADGIVGPHRQKEGSYFTIKEVWAPVTFEPKEITAAFNGELRFENRFFYTNTNQCTFSYKLAQMQSPSGDRQVESREGKIQAPDVQPGNKGILTIDLPADWENYDVLYVTAKDPYNREIFTWSWPISRPADFVSKILKKDGKQSVNMEETDTYYHVSANGVNLSFDKKNGTLYEVKNQKGIIPFKNGPTLSDGKALFKEIKFEKEGETLVITSEFEKKGSEFKEVKWTVFPSGWLQMDIQYFPSDYDSDLIGVNFSFPEELVTGVQWLGDGPYRVWKNRMQGNKLGVWEKKYNNTLTGHPGFEYPEFKGYHSRLYWAKILTKEQAFTVISGTEDVFLRLFTPQSPKDPYNTAPAFPEGDISFMQGIPPIGTKSQKPENMGPSGRKNMYFDYWKARPKTMTLFFDFTEKQLLTSK